jgi:hypothetical protein
VHLVDILDNKINTVAWTIEEIKMIIIDLINRDINYKYVREEVSQDPIEQVSTAQVSYVNYIYDAIRESINNHVKSLNIRFELLIKGKMYKYNLEKCGMVIVLEYESIRCYLDLQHAEQEKSFSICIEQEKSFSFRKSLPRNHDFATRNTYSTPNS